MGDDHVHAGQLLATGDPMGDVLPVMEHELQAQVMDASARAAGAGPPGVGRRERCLEGRVAGAQAGDHGRPADARAGVVGDGEDGVALELDELERRDDGGDDLVEEARDERVCLRGLVGLHDERVVGRGHPLQEPGVAGDVGQQQGGPRPRAPIDRVGHAREASNTGGTTGGRRGRRRPPPWSVGIA